MIIHVGSTNKLKVNSIKNIVMAYPDFFLKPNVIGIDVNVPTHGHPKNLEETISGAIDRAKKAFNSECSFSFGLEGGLLEVPQSNSGFMETNACAIYDGKKVYLGLSSAFEWPKKVTEMILNGEADANLAFKNLNLTEEEKLGSQQGGISGMLSKGRLGREDQIKQSVIMALIQIENKTIYQ